MFTVAATTSTDRLADLEPPPTTTDDAIVAATTSTDTIPVDSPPTVDDSAPVCAGSSISIKRYNELFAIPQAKLDDARAHTLTAMFPDPTNKYVQKIFDACVQHLQSSNVTFQFMFHTDEPIEAITATNIRHILNNKYTGEMYSIDLNCMGVSPITKIDVHIYLRNNAKTLNVPTHTLY